MSKQSKRISAAMLATMLVALLQTNRAQAYIDLAPTLAKIVTDSKSISVVEVVEFDRAKHELVLKDIRALKGEASTELIHHKVVPADGTTIPRQISQWAAPGARTVMFSSRATALICVGQCWYQVRASENGPAQLGNERPDLPLAFYGKLSRLTDGITAMLAGKDAVLTVVAFGADDEGASFDLALNRHNLPGSARLQRIRANLKMPGMVMGSSSNPQYFIGLGSLEVSDVPQLIEKLNSTEATARAEAADDLRSLGRQAFAARETLTKLLNDPDPIVRIWASSALLRIDPKSTASITPLAEALESANPTLRREAARAAGLAGSAAGPLTAKLAKLLSDSDESIRLASLQAISLLGRSASGAVDAVIPLLDNPEFQIDAADALGRIGSSAQAALPKLAQMLSSEQSAVRWAAVRGMSQIGGPDAHPAVEFIIKALPTATEVEGYNMMIYLSLLGPVAKDALPAVRNTPIKNPVLPSSTQWAMSPTEYLPWQGGGGRSGRGFGGPGGPGGGGDLNTFMYAAYVRELGPRLSPVAKMLALKIMDNTAGEVPSWGYALLACGPKEALEVLTPHLESSDGAARERAAVALGYMRSAASDAVPQIQVAVSKASNEQERRLLQWTLREIEKE